HQAEDFSPDSEHLKWLHRIVGNAKAFINGTYHGTSTKHLQMYLSEYCYRFNRRSFGGAIFDRLLIAIAQ
ncbi:MAG: transposase, partial [Oscillospiraceae bacterium]|nr:transposase [Oscillospiraceae bacterium]